VSPHQFTVDGKGVHLMNPRNGEFTLCGFAFDAWLSEEGWEYGELQPTDRQIVTCPDCIEIIQVCKSVRTSPWAGT
jgi:hypothetical protein